MGDIVDRLRAGKVLQRFEDGSYLSEGPSEACIEAADEIERLRKALNAIAVQKTAAELGGRAASADYEFAHGVMIEIARKALNK